jgi:putative chitinase
MAGNYSFNISILCLNPFQVQIGDYSYTYRDYGPESIEQWKNEFGPGSLEEKLQFELEDFYNGDFFDEFGTYPGLRGPGGGGYSASSYVRDVASGSITPEAEVRSRTGFELQVEMNFDKDKILANNGEGVKKVESDLRYVIETAFKNSVAYKKEVYLDPIFTRDNRRRASNNPTFSSNGKPDPGYTPNGKTYSIPQTPDFKLNRSLASETTDNYYLSYFINEITPTPKKEPIAGSPSEPVGASPSVIAATPSNDGLIRGEYVFNVEKSKIFSNPELGELSIVEQVVGGEGEEDAPLFIFDDSQGDSPQEDEPLDSEYSEGTFVGNEEQLISFSDSDGPNLNIETISEIKGEDPENPDPVLTTESTPFPISKDVDKNIKTIISAAKKAGITNKFAISAMLAISKKESGLVPKSESSYAKTSASRIKSIFSVFRKNTDSEVDKIKTDAKQFFDKIYGGKYGNASDEGFKYRGRGLNQITFKGNYKKYADSTKHDIVNNPDLLNDIEVAADCLASYFKSNFQKAPQSIKTRYNFKDVNSFKNLDDATGAFYHANAGWGKSYEEIVADSTGGRKKSFNYVGTLYNNYNNIM